MIVQAPVVLVSAREAQDLLELAAPEVARRMERGALPDRTQRTLANLVELTRSDCSDSAGRSPQVADFRRSDGGRPTFRSPNLNGMTTAAAAARFGISPRAVIARLHRGALAGEQQASGRWIVHVESDD